MSCNRAADKSLQGQSSLAMRIKYSLLICSEACMCFAPIITALWKSPVLLFGKVAVKSQAEGSHIGAGEVAVLWARSDDHITVQSKVINKQKEIAIVLLSPDLSKQQGQRVFMWRHNYWWMASSLCTFTLSINCWRDEQSLTTLLAWLAKATENQLHSMKQLKAALFPVPAVCSG